MGQLFVARKVMSLSTPEVSSEKGAATLVPLLTVYRSMAGAGVNVTVFTPLDTVTFLIMGAGVSLAKQGSRYAANAVSVMNRFIYSIGTCCGESSTGRAVFKRRKPRAALDRLSSRGTLAPA